VQDGTYWLTLDNLSVHKQVRVRQAIEVVGARALFLPS